MGAPRWRVSVKGVLICDEGVVLLHNERDEWELPGGQLEDGESPPDCVARELAEELGVTATAEELLDTWVYEVLPGSKVLIITYGVVANRTAPLEVSIEHDQVALVSVSDLDRYKIPEGYRTSIRTWASRQQPGSRSPQ